MHSYGNGISARVGAQQISLRGKAASDKESLLGSAVEHLRSLEGEKGTAKNIVSLMP